MRTLLEQFPSIKRAYLFDLSSAASDTLTNSLQEQFPHVDFVPMASVEYAVCAADVIVTCTVTDTPYLPFEWLKPGAFISNVSIMDVCKEVYEKAHKVVVDDWDQSNCEKKIITSD